VLLGQKLVERDEVRLDRRRDDVRPARLALVFALSALAGRQRWRDPDGHHADRVGPLPQRVDVVREQARMPVEDLRDRLVDRLVERIDRAHALGRGLPMVVARIDDDGATTAGVGAG
jgi:hypothetical protein